MKLGLLLRNVLNSFTLHLFIGLLYISGADQEALNVDNENYNVSLSSGWRRVARYLRESTDFTVDPCVDFFKFACGAWTKLNPIPEFADRQDAFTLVRDNVKESIRQIFAEDQLLSHSSKTLRLTKQVYDSCIHQTILPVNESHPLMGMVNSLGGWPLLDPSAWEERNFEPEATIGLLWRLHSLPTLLAPGIMADKWNSSYYVLYLDQAFLSFGLKSEDYYLKNNNDYLDVRHAYVKLIQEVLTLLFNDSNRYVTKSPLPEKQISEILEFEISLAKLNTPAYKRREETDLLMKIGFKDLLYIAPGFDWHKYARSMTLEGYLERNGSVVLAGVSYFRKVALLLAKTPKKTLANYLIWRLIFDQMIFLDERYRVKLYDFVDVMRGATEPKRPDFCISYMTGEPNDGREFLAYAVGRVFVDHYFSSESKKDIQEMIDNLISSFLTIIDELDWMDQVTKRAAKDKARAIYSSIGYPDFIMDDQLLDAYYSDLIPPENNDTEEWPETVIRPGDSLFRIHNRVIKWMIDRLVAKLGTKFHRESFGGSPATVNAWYSHFKNSIVFPAAILQPPFFHTTFPKAINYGAMGSVIGHEITHAFDDQGSQYDKHGNLVNWWSPASKKLFWEKKKCIIKQYSNFCYPHLQNNTCLNGYHTQGENIADNGGLKEAFAGYRRYVAKHGPEPRLPSLEQYTMEQVFFMGFASFWCGHCKDRHLINLLAVNEHSPGEYRVIGSLQNSEDFRNAFNCSTGQRMAPAKSCVVW
uniref:Peptidase M13 C-terminal domain-containing protein n=1 Tax=Trichuris muris TaxID=70415 RepID=A0A5S6QI76_TRIMR